MRGETRKEFGNAIAGTASVMIRPVKGGKVAVVAYVPPGIDLYPIVYGRFNNEGEAMTTFTRACAEVERMVS